MDGVGHEVADDQVLAMLEVAGEGGGLAPLEVPGVVDGDEGIGAGDDVADGEAAVEVALVAAEEFQVGLGIFGDQDDHDAGGGLVAVMDEAFDGDYTRGEEESYFGRRTWCQG